MRKKSPKESCFPVIGLGYLCFFGAEAFIMGSYDIYLAMGQPFWGLYQIIYALGGLFLLSVLGCVLLVLFGNFFAETIAPCTGEAVLEVKLKYYESVADKIHAGKRNKLETSGEKTGREDVAFYQYAYSEDWEDGSRATNHVYILYSEDDICDVELPKRKPSSYSQIKLEQIQTNWYKMKVVSVWMP